jgi:lactoylglutathione lyase
MDDSERTVTSPKEQGVTVTLEPKTLTEGHDYEISLIEDPDGYKMELLQRGKMKAGHLVP